MCLCIFNVVFFRSFALSLSLSNHFFFPSWTENNSVHNEFGVWYNFQRTAWLLVWANGFSSATYYFPFFFSSSAPLEHHNNRRKKQTICIAFRFIPFIIFVRHYKSLDLRSHYSITTTATATTTMKMDHFVKSLLLNMIVVWHFPPSFIKILVIFFLFHLNWLSML